MNVQPKRKNKFPKIVREWPIVLTSSRSDGPERSVCCWWKFRRFCDSASPSRSRPCAWWRSDAGTRTEAEGRWEWSDRFRSRSPRIWAGCGSEPDPGQPQIRPGSTWPGRAPSDRPPTETSWGRPVTSLALVFSGGIKSSDASDGRGKLQNLEEKLAPNIFKSKQTYYWT